MERRIDALPEGAGSSAGRFAWLERSVCSLLLALAALIPCIQVGARILSRPGIAGAGEYLQHLVLWIAFAALQSGMVDVFTASPLTAAAMQWFALAPHMTDFNWTPLTGGLVISAQAWRRIPAELRPELQRATQAALEGLTAEVEKVEAQAMEIMKKNGLVVNHVDAAQLQEWHKLVERGLKILMDNPISRDIYEEAASYLEEYRKAHGG